MKWNVKNIRRFFINFFGHFKTFFNNYLLWISFYFLPLISKWLFFKNNKSLQKITKFSLRKGHFEINWPLATALKSYIKWLLYIYIYFFFENFWKSWKNWNYLHKIFFMMYWLHLLYSGLANPYPKTSRIQRKSIRWPVTKKYSEKENVFSKGNI